MTHYVDNTLVAGEKIICSAHYHWFYWAKRLICYALALGIAAGIDFVIPIPLPVVTTLAGICCAGSFVLALMLYYYDEMVITNHRVVLKTGIFSRDVFEMQIQKVETVLVDQSIAGRMFDYGTIACRGTGGTVSKQIEIASPLEFRAAFQTAVKESQSMPAPSVLQGAQNNEQKFDEIIGLLREIRDELRKG